MYRSNKFFDRCFVDQSYRNIYLRDYLKIIDRRIEYPFDGEYYEEWFIVPKCWFRLQGLEIDESQDNIVKLSVREYIKAMTLLIYYFLQVGQEDVRNNVVQAMYSMDDSVGINQMMYNKLVEKMMGFTGFSKRRLLQSSFILSGSELDSCEKKRIKMKQEDRKYSQEYLERCYQIYKSEKNVQDGFKKVQSEMGFKYSKRTLLDQFRKYLKDGND